MTSRPSYGVTVEREDQLWTATVTGLPSDVFGATDTERFADLDEMVRDLIATLTDVPSDSFDLEWRYVQGPTDYTLALHQAQHWAEQLRTAEAHRDASRAAAAEMMVRAGLSQRAIGDALGLSHQRVGQILSILKGPIAAPAARRAG